jgi:NAD(P)H dehydrogenase (quinone)
VPLVKQIVATLVPVADVEKHWDVLDNCDAMIFGARTNMGSISADFKRFMEATSGRYFEQRWNDKLAAGFTNLGSQNGDKLNTLQAFVLFAAQHGMHWLSLGLLSGNNRSTSTAGELNRRGSWLGAMAPSNADQGPAAAPPEADRRTDQRVVRSALRWRAGTHSVPPETQLRHPGVTAVVR